MGKRQRQDDDEQQPAAKREESEPSSSDSESSGSGGSSSSSDDSSSDSGSASSSGSGSDSDGGAGGGHARAAPAKRVGVPVRVIRGGAADASPPFLAYFSNGSVPAYANSPAAPGRQPWRFQVYEAPGAGQQPMMVSEQGCATLIGRPGDPELSAPGCQYVLGVYDKEERTLQLVGAQGGQFARVEAHVNGVNYGHAAGAAHADAARQAEIDADVKARRGMATRLVEAFGSTRRRRQLKSREEGAVRADKLLSSDAAEAALAAVNKRAAEEGGTRTEVLSRVAAQRNIPPHNLDATEPHKAYPLKGMFPEACLAAVNVGQLLHAVDKPSVLDSITEKKLVPEYVLSRLPLLRSLSDEKARKGKARVLAVLAALLQIAGPNGAALRVPAGGLDDLARGLRIGKREVLEGFLDLFYHKSAGEDGAERWVRDNSKRELMTAYAIVAALDAEGWAMAGPQFEALAAQLRMSLADLAQRCRELGCVCTAVKGSDYRDGKSYTAALLQQPSRGAAAPKTLGECLPKPKGPPKARGR